MLNVNPYEDHVSARLFDFFGFKTPWQRGLWTSGIVLTLREAIEASEAVAVGALSDGALHHIASHAIILAGKDPGVGDSKQKTVLQDTLKTDQKNGGLRFQGVQHRILSLLTNEIEPRYLERWSEALSDPAARPGPERTARCIASHLLDAGFSSDYLHHWWTYKSKHEPGTKSLSELVKQAHNLVVQPTRKFEVLVAFERAPAPTGGSPVPSEWVANKDVSKWLRTHGFDVSGLRQRGGLRLEIASRDPIGAAEIAAEVVERLTSRVSLGSYKPLTPIQKLWIAGERDPIPLRFRRRRVEVHALYRENRLYSTGELNFVDAAMELAAPLDSESPSPAVAGGWASIEALLTGPGDRERVLAADRMASLVACSFPRAELTAVSYSLEKQGGAIAEKLRACADNRDRSALVAQFVTEKVPLKFADGSDNAALSSLASLLQNPAATMRDIEHHASVCFRRLYRHRNMVLHWGKTNATGIRACLRTAGPLVGAGLDRIAHAWFVEGLHPLELAARARIGLDTLGSANGCSPVDMLE